MNEYSSKKIKTLSFVAMIMVLFVHSFNYSLYFDTNYTINPFFLFIENYISFHLCRVAVPIFFIVSGYFLMKNYQLKLSSYLEKLKSRFKSLMIPYVLWVSLWSVFFYLISSIPQLTQFINNPLRPNKTVWLNLYNIFTNPICYQLWFIKDLIFLIIFSPILYFLQNKLGLFIIIFSFINLVFSIIDIPFFQNSSLFYFIIGIGIYFNRIHFVKRFLKVNTWILGSIWIGIYFILKIKIHSYSIIEFITPISILLGISFLWKLYDIIYKEDLIFNGLESQSKYSFFLFASHEPLMISLKKIGFTILGITNEIRLALYFIIPILTYSLCVFAGYCIDKYFPKPYKILTGGR